MKNYNLYMIINNKIIILSLILNIFYCHNINDILYFNQNNIIFNDCKTQISRPDNQIDIIMDEIKKLGAQFLFKISFNSNIGNKTELYNILFEINKNKKCTKFIEMILGKKREFLNLIANSLLKGGIISNAIGLEDECLNKDEVYLFISGQHQYNSTNMNYDKFSNQHMVFIESLYFHEEICIWKDCNDAYQPLLEYIIKYYNDAAKIMFGFEKIKIEGVNYYTNTTTKKTYYDYKSKNDEYINNINNILYIFLVSVIFCTLIIILIENKDNFQSSKKKRSEKRISFVIDTIDSEFEENILIAKEKKCQDNYCYKIIAVFNIFNNFLLLNKKKEPLADQNNLVELSLIRLVIIFFIMIGENSYIILKYVDKGMSLIALTNNFSFILIKIGCISYEYYKIICGVVFGFKFMNYYKKSENFGFKRISRFIFKFVPYFAIYLIIHFGINYPIVNYIKYYWGSIRNNYLSEKMNECYCVKNITNIFFPKTIMNKYNETEFNIGQYNGCFRYNLFTISEFFCYLIVLFISVSLIKMKCKFFELFFFITNFIYLSLFYFLNREVKDIKGEYTLSRFFGLSSSVAKPYFFFPLYYIGFNIGIVYYYHLHEADTFNELNKCRNNYIPFEYCYKIAILLGRIGGKIKNTIIILSILFMVFISSYYSIIMRNLNRYSNQLIFNFEEKPFTKFMYIYEGSLSGIIFSLFIIIYLSSNSRSLFKIVFSSNMFIFGHKIAFILFNSFYSILRFFHGISIMELYISTFYLFKNTLTLFVISCLFSILIVIIVFFPIKWIYYFIWNGFTNEYYE